MRIHKFVPFVVMLSLLVLNVLWFRSILERDTGQKDDDTNWDALETKLLYLEAGCMERYAECLFTYPEVCADFKANLLKLADISVADIVSNDTNGWPIELGRSNLTIAGQVRFQVRGHDHKLVEVTFDSQNFINWSKVVVELDYNRCLAMADGSFVCV